MQNSASSSTLMKSSSQKRLKFTGELRVNGRAIGAAHLARSCFSFFIVVVAPLLSIPCCAYPFPQF